MTWATFFRSSQGRGILAGIVTVIIGTTLSATFALKFATCVSTEINDFLDSMGENFTISKLTADLLVKNRTLTITLNNINAALPSDILDMAENLGNLLSNQCFTLPLIFGLIFTVIIALEITNLVDRFFQYIQNNNKKSDDYELLPNEAPAGMRRNRSWS